MSKQIRRANVSDTVKMSLLCEVNGSCPLCRSSLMRRKASGPVRVFDVAHIYPLNATEHEIEILDGEERLSEDIDCEQNMIPLCRPCHKMYDTNKTVKEYLHLVSIKKEIAKALELYITWDRQAIHKDIEVVVNSISEAGNRDNEDTRLSYSALKLSEKKDDTLGSINEIKIENFIVMFFIPIQNSFKQLELSEKAKSAFIFSQVRSYYFALLMQGYNQNKIFEKVCEWFMQSGGLLERDKAEVLASFFIQNCEVFSDVNA